MIKRRKYIIILTICLLALISSVVFFVIEFNRTRLSSSQIFICDNAKQFSDFDNWLMDDIDVDKVPSYVIIKNKKVIGVLPGNIPEKDFSIQYTNLLENPAMSVELPKYSIQNIDGVSSSLYDICNEDITILEISWATCKDCIEQDTFFTRSIYFIYSPKLFRRYYIKTEKSEIHL